MTDPTPPTDINSLTNALWSDLQQLPDAFSSGVLLAHYTNLSVVEQIIRNNEIWFSNPLYMNDLEELRGYSLRGLDYYRAAQSIHSALGTTELADLFVDELEASFKAVLDPHVLDTYVLCLSEHSPDDVDGLLSMWRGYGDHGRGAALIVDPSRLTALDDSPLQIAKVTYATPQRRDAWLQWQADCVASVLQTQGPTPGLIAECTNALVRRLRTAALFSKHSGFSEEREWRVVYFPDFDTSGMFTSLFHYHITPRGPEPKLKLKIGATGPQLGVRAELSDLLHTILLGPSLQAPLPLESTKRMLQKLDRPELVDRVVASRIPYRQSGANF